MSCTNTFFLSKISTRRYQAIRDSFISHVTRFAADKYEQENYFKALQALYIRLLRVYMYHNRQNQMTFDLLNALKSRRSSIDTLQREIDRLTKLKESKASSIDIR